MNSRQECALSLLLRTPVASGLSVISGCDHPVPPASRLLRGRTDTPTSADFCSKVKNLSREGEKKIGKEGRREEGREGKEKGKKKQGKRKGKKLPVSLPYCRSLHGGDPSRLARIPAS